MAARLRFATLLAALVMAMGLILLVGRDKLRPISLCIGGWVSYLPVHSFEAPHQTLVAFAGATLMDRRCLLPGLSQRSGMPRKPQCTAMPRDLRAHSKWPKNTNSTRCAERFSAVFISQRGHRARTAILRTVTCFSQVVQPGEHSIGRPFKEYVPSQVPANPLRSLCRLHGCFRAPLSIEALSHTKTKRNRARGDRNSHVRGFRSDRTCRRAALDRLEPHRQSVMGVDYVDQPFSSTIASVPVQNPSRNWASLNALKQDP